MSYTEAPFSANLRVGDWMITTRANDAFELQDGMALIEEFAQKIRVGMQGATEPAPVPQPAPVQQQQYVPPVQEQQVQQQYVQPQQPQYQQPDTGQAIQNLQQAGITGQVIPTPLEERTDKFGGRYIKGDPNGQACVHGPRITAYKTSKAGSPYTAYVCLNASPFGDSRNGKCDVVYPPR